MQRDLIDTYLAACVRACHEGSAMPIWPDGLSADHAEEIGRRIRFHGIALLLAQHSPGFPGWPAAVTEAVKDEARMQALWEASHRRAVLRLIEGLAAAGITAAIMKGTALAYGFHADPAIRRRGDTDLYLPGADRRAALAVLRRCGFEPYGDRALTQEPWALATPDGFFHEVDIHWRINSSATVSRSLDRLQCETRMVPLPRFAPGAIALGPLDNLILTCVNRYAHQCFGYHVEDTRPADGDRLIWAVDIKLLTADFTTAAWERLAALAAISGTSSVVHSALAFAQARLGLELPDGYLEKLAAAKADMTVSRYLGEPSAARRLRMEMAAARSTGELALMLRLWLLPGRKIMAARFPDARGWPMWALHLRRITGVVLGRLGLPV